VHALQKARFYDLQSRLTNKKGAREWDLLRLLSSSGLFDAVCVIWEICGQI